MEFLGKTEGIISSQEKLEGVEAVWSIYQNSFPAMERRSREVYERLCQEEPQFSPERIEIEGEAAALMWHWEMPKFTYIEHFAVSKRFRNKGIGSKVLKRFFRRHKRIILEIEPPETEIQKRRLGFYERLGFKQTGFHYINPGFGLEPKAHRLEILSFPDAMTASEFDHFKNFVHQRVLKYEPARRKASLLRSPKCRA